MKTSALVPIVAYLGLAGLSSAAPLPASEAEVALDKRTFCFFGIGWGCNSNSPATTSSAAAKSTAASSAAKSSAAKSSAVTTSSAVKSSAAVSSAAPAKVSSVAPAASSAKATNAAVTKTGTAAWAQCTDFDWSAWDDKKVSWGGFNKQYVQDWYLAEYGLAPPPGMNWRQVSSLVNKFAVQTPATGPKTTSKATKGCSNPWTSAAPATKTKAITVTTAKPVTPSTTPVKSAATSAAAQSSAAGNKSSASGAASAGKPIASSAGPAPSSAAAGKPSASSAAGPASSAAGPASSAAGPASSASASPVVAAPAQSSIAAPAQSSAAESAQSSAAGAASPSSDPASASPSPATPSPSADGSSGLPGVGSGVPGTGAGLPGTGAGANNGTATIVPEPEATEVAPVSINGYTYGGCAQEIVGRLLDKVQTQSSSQTIESCTALCASYGFAVSGLEYGSECYCGTLEDIEDAELSGECKMPCSGNADQTCGGPNAINWYYDADQVAPTVQLPAGWTTYGVVTEGTNGARVMSTLLYASNDNTIEKCAAGCAAAGYKVAGTEYSSECFCSNGFLASSGGGQLVDDSAAFMKCSGNIAQSCGGPSILSVTSAFGDDIPFI